jgi:hypothetical protein
MKSSRLLKSLVLFPIWLFLTFSTALMPAQSNPLPQSTFFPQTRSEGIGVRALPRSHSQKRLATLEVSTGPEQVLYTFLGGNDGGLPSGVISDSSGNLYGTTQAGGEGACTAYGVAGCGTVFELSPNSNGGWTETVLYSFQDGSDGATPEGGLVFDQAGNLYGTTQSGGGEGGCSAIGSGGCGTAFELSPNSNGGWTETVILYVPIPRGLAAKLRIDFRSERKPLRLSVGRGNRMW